MYCSLALLTCTLVKSDLSIGFLPILKGLIWFRIFLVAPKDSLHWSCKSYLYNNESFLTLSLFVYC